MSHAVDTPLNQVSSYLHARFQVGRRLGKGRVEKDASGATGDVMVGWLAGWPFGRRASSLLLSLDLVGAAAGSQRELGVRRVVADVLICHTCSSKRSGRLRVCVWDNVTCSYLSSRRNHRVPGAMCPDWCFQNDQLQNEIGTRLCVCFQSRSLRKKHREYKSNVG